jgi:hypothetical protein
VLRELAERLGIRDFYPWTSAEGPIDAILDHAATGHATVASLRADGGIRPLAISHVAHPDLRFPTPSGRIELYSERARQLGLPRCRSTKIAPPPPFLARTYADAVPRHDKAARCHAGGSGSRPRLWISPDDA